MAQQTNSNINPQSGQTLIEVIIALLILTMALVAGLGLAVYSSSRNVNNRNLTVANNLAREGIEAARILRDTNWLAAEDQTPAGITQGVDDLHLQGGGCSFGGGTNYPCYPEAFTEPYDLGSSNNPNTFRAVFNPAGAGPNITLDQRSGGETFLLCLQADGTYRDVNCNESQAQFARRVMISTGRTNQPFTSENGNPNANNGHSPEKIVTSVVVWKGKGCAEFTNNLNPVTFNTNCKTTVTERLTNWKDYR